jgi:hypothetical protein
MSVLKDLIGMPVTRAAHVLDYTQLDFGEDATLSIMNDFALSGVDSLEELIGKALLGVAESELTVSFEFNESASVTVSLSEEAYHCPEAMTLHREGRPVCVWN